MKMRRRKKSKMLLYVLLLCVLLAGCHPLKAEEDGKCKESGTKEKEVEKASEDTEPEQEVEVSSDTGNVFDMDPGFWEIVCSYAGIGEEDSRAVIREKLEQCENLEVREAPYGTRVCSLKDLAYLPHLKTLSITFQRQDDSRIEDFTPIADLHELKELHISYVEEEDLSFLGEMHTVTELFLSSCQLKDTAFLGEMSQLESLSLSMTPVDDMAVLENLTELKKLSLAGNQGASNIEIIGKLSKLEDLELRECGIGDIQFLSSLKELRALNLNSNSISDITPLEGLTGLERLELSKNELCDLSPLANLTNLYMLSLEGNEIRDISPLLGLSRLNQAELSDNQIVDFSPLEGKTELLYASVSGNPCKSLKPLLHLPILSVGGRREPSEKQLKIAAGQIEKKWPDLEEYTCIDFAEGDLNGDGRMDVAFVVEGEFWKIERAYDSYSRRLVVLLGQADGSFREVPHMISVWDKEAGGTRGDPYGSIWMETGYVLLEQSFGSSGGAVVSELYCWQNGRLELSSTIRTGDSRFAFGYDVSVYEEAQGEEYRFAIAFEDGWRMVRVDLADREHPIHKAFPKMELYDVSYIIHSEKLKVSTEPSAALKLLLERLGRDMIQEKLPYAAWQKEGYERLKGVNLPDFYYVRKDSRASENEETENGGEYLYYCDLIEQQGEYFHEILYEREEERKTYWVNDSTREIIEK